MPDYRTSHSRKKYFHSHRPENLQFIISLHVCKPYYSLITLGPSSFVCLCIAVSPFSGKLLWYTSYMQVARCFDIVLKMAQAVVHRGPHRRAARTHQLPISCRRECSSTVLVAAARTNFYASRFNYVWKSSRRFKFFFLFTR